MAKAKPFGNKETLAEEQAEHALVKQTGSVKKAMRVAKAKKKTGKK